MNSGINLVRVPTRPKSLNKAKKARKGICSPRSEGIYERFLQ